MCKMCIYVSKNLVVPQYSDNFPRNLIHVCFFLAPF